MKLLTALVAITMSLAIAAGAAYGQADLFACQSRNGKDLRLVEDLNECSGREIGVTYTVESPANSVRVISENTYDVIVDYPTTSDMVLCTARNSAGDTLPVYRDPLWLLIYCYDFTRISDIHATDYGLAVRCDGYEAKRVEIRCVIR